MIPLVHDFRDERVLVFGGGSVGARKARRFAQEADVTVVSPTFVDESFGDADQVRAEPGPEDVDRWIDQTDPALVVAASDDSDLNATVATVASERNLLYNRADEAGERDADSVVVPATVRSDPVVVSISTGGQSPALSRYLRKHLSGAIENAGEMAQLTGSLREDLKSDGVPAGTRRSAVRAVVHDDDVWKALDSGRSNPQQIAETVIRDVTGDSS